MWKYVHEPIELPQLAWYVWIHLRRLGSSREVRRHACHIGGDLIMQPKAEAIPPSTKSTPKRFEVLKGITRSGSAPSSFLTAGARDDDQRGQPPQLLTYRSPHLWSLTMECLTTIYTHGRHYLISEYRWHQIELIIILNMCRTMDVPCHSNIESLSGAHPLDNHHLPP